MNMKVKTPGGTISASYLRRSKDGDAIGIHAGLYGKSSIVSFEYDLKYGGLCLVINHAMLDECGIRLVSRVGGWDGIDLIHIREE